MTADREPRQQTEKVNEAVTPTRVTVVVYILIIDHMVQIRVYMYEFVWCVHPIDYHTYYIYRDDRRAWHCPFPHYRETDIAIRRNPGVADTRTTLECTYRTFTNANGCELCEYCVNECERARPHRANSVTRVRTGANYNSLRIWCDDGANSV